LIAITRGVSPGIVRCELTHIDRQAIDLELARAQHRRYEMCLAELGCEVVSLPADPDLPDSVFIEDAAVVLEELAVITRPGAASRRAETAAVASALRPYRALHWIEAPGTIDGGDVLRVGRTLFVGLSSRTNPSGAEQLRRLAEPLGYRVRGVGIGDCLHLKSAVTLVSEDTLLVNKSWVDGEAFGPIRLIEVSPEEPWAANALLVTGTVLYPAAYPLTRRRLEGAGIELALVEVSELAKAEGGVTCCSLLFKEGGRECTPT
jgi:dimethylargininase